MGANGYLRTGVNTDITKIIEIYNAGGKRSNVFGVCYNCSKPKGSGPKLFSGGGCCFDFMQVKTAF